MSSSYLLLLQFTFDMFAHLHHHFGPSYPHESLSGSLLRLRTTLPPAFSRLCDHFFTLDMHHRCGCCMVELGCGTTSSFALYPSTTTSSNSTLYTTASTVQSTLDRTPAGAAEVSKKYIWLSLSRVLGFHREVRSTPESGSQNPQRHSESEVFSKLLLLDCTL